MGVHDGDGLGRGGLKAGETGYATRTNLTARTSTSLHAKRLAVAWTTRNSIGYCRMGSGIVARVTESTIVAVQWQCSGLSNCGAESDLATWQRHYSRVWLHACGCTLTARSPGEPRFILANRLLCVAAALQQHCGGIVAALWHCSGVVAAL